MLVNTDLAPSRQERPAPASSSRRTARSSRSNHVIAGATTIKVTIPATHKIYTADVLGYDPTDDIALLKLEGASNLATATTGNSAKLKIGQATQAVGNANGGGKLIVTKGKVVGLNRTISVQQDDGSFSKLANLVATPPEARARRLRRPAHRRSRPRGRRRRGRLRERSQRGRVRDRDQQGALDHQADRDLARLPARPHRRHRVHGHRGPGRAERRADRRYFPGSPAETAGLANGDVITAMDGTPVTDSADLRTILFGHHPGDSITLTYTDLAGNPATASVTLADGPPV